MNIHSHNANSSSPFRKLGRRSSTVALFLAVVLMVHADISRAASQDANNQDLGTRMVTYLKERRFDDAVQAGLQALKHDPSDEMIYNEIGVIYLTRAQEDAKSRDLWVKDAVSYTEKALMLNRKDADVAGVAMFHHARNFERAGDLATVERCSYYERSRMILKNRATQLQGDHIELEGKTFPLAPLRDENEKVLAEVSAKARNADCK